MTRALELQARGPGQHEVRNAGFQAWPAGRLLMAGRVHELQALAPGAVQMLADQAGRPPTDTAARTAITRGPVQGAAALWQLELAGVVDAPLESKGWLLVSVPSR